MATTTNTNTNSTTSTTTANTASASAVAVNQPVRLPDIPSKRYFTIGEVSELCGVKAHVLRYWEQEFEVLAPLKRRGNRRYYQRYEVQLIRHIRELLYDQGFTIAGARTKLELLRTNMPIVKEELTLDESGNAVMLTMAGIHTEVLNIARMLDPGNRFLTASTPA
jgi:DNA-binding transcriptional MerR regulator